MSPLALSLRFLQTQPDARLVELARAGHERAFEALVQRYRRPLLGYCRRISPTGLSPEDVLQQALLQAWIAITGHETDVREARAWLYRIVHNVAISMLRRASLEATHLELPESENGADHEVERRIAAREALAGLASLPELQRELLLATALEGRSHDELATSLGLTHGAVRGLIYRARATLRAAAAVVVPAPLVNWAARQTVEQGGGSAAVLETLGGGGSAGLGAVLLKGGAIVVSAGALAGAAGIGSIGPSHRHRAATGSAGSRMAARAASASAAVPLYASAAGTTGTPRGSRGALPATFTFARIPAGGRSAPGNGSHRIGDGPSGPGSSNGSANGGSAGSGSGASDGSSGGEHGGGSDSGAPSSSGASASLSGGGSGGDDGSDSQQTRGRSGSGSGSRSRSGSGSGSGSGSASSTSGGSGSDGSAQSDDAVQSSAGGAHGHGGDGSHGPNAPVTTGTSTASGSGD